MHTPWYREVVYELANNSPILRTIKQFYAPRVYELARNSP